MSANLSGFFIYYYFLSRGGKGRRKGVEGRGGGKRRWEGAEGRGGGVRTPGE